MIQKRFGFGLIELMLLIAMLLFSTALLVPAVQRVRETAGRKQILDNLKQLCLATHMTNDVYKLLPPASGTYGGITAASGSKSLSVHLLPYVEQSALYAKVQFGKEAPTNVVIPPFTATLDFSTTDFMRVQNFCSNIRVFANDGVVTAWDRAVPMKGTMYGNSGIPRTFVDGTSQSVFFATRYASSGTASSNGDSKTPCSYYDVLTSNDGGAFFGATPMAQSPLSAASTSGWQVVPSLSQVNCAFAVGMAHSFDTTGIQIGLGDASVRTIAPSISATTWNYAMCPNDGNALGRDW